MKPAVFALLTLQLAYCNDIQTSTTCDSFLSVVTGPLSCYVSDDFSTEQASIVFTNPPEFDLVADMYTSAGPQGESPASATATLSEVMTGYFVMGITGQSAGGDGGSTFITIDLGPQHWQILSPQYLDVEVQAAPGDLLSAMVRTSGEGTGHLEIQFTAVPEPSTLPLVAFGAALLLATKRLRV